MNEGSFDEKLTENFYDKLCVIPFFERQNVQPPEKGVEGGGSHEHKRTNAGNVWREKSRMIRM